MSKLLILGNGFDLNCGLKSSYKDFFSERFDDNILSLFATLKTQFEETTFFNQEYNYGQIYFEKAHHYIPNKLKTLKSITTFKHLTFWDLVLFYSNDSIDLQWNDIERTLETFLSIDFANTEKPNIYTSFNKRGNRSRSSLCSAIFYSFFEESRWKNFESERDFLMAELNLFESAFSTYLTENLTNNKIYEEKAADLYSSLLNLYHPDNYYSAQHYSIINFNYTDNLESSIAVGPPIDYEYYVNSRNIHGSLKNNNIIFGIDPKGLNSGHANYRFTKIYRQMIGNFLNSENNKILKKDTHKEIIFYGHSLSRLDYSYFQSIFDYYKLYDSDITLIFYYSNYDPSNKLNIQKEMIHRVNNLLDEYSKTLENSSHADNLISKLIIENRLNVEELITN